MDQASGPRIPLGAEDIPVEIAQILGVEKTAAALAERPQQGRRADYRRAV